MRILLAGCFALTACGVGADAEAGAPEDLSSATTTVRVSATGEAPMSFEKHFPIWSTDAVYFVADVKAPADVQNLAFEVVDPSGDVYQRISVPVVDARTVAVMPVLGTWISQYDLSGQWQCRVFLDGSSTEAAHVAFLFH